ncbi:MAG: carboxypeptidase-like regulatory domain-containing protein [Gemmatimonadaceae bacterium]|nr:carboxypeptidase-like regulatory domain-containing protein [Gemmatimonadaceae bacterium]
MIDSRDAFDGAPHNFFDDTLSACAAGNPNCFLYEAYPVIQPNENTAPRRVGFVIDPTVNRFRARLLIAANLENAVATFGTISGTVSSATLGPLAGVTVSAGAGFTAVTSATGTYSIPSVPTGNRTVTITSALPAGCSATSQSTTVAADPAATTVNFAVAGCIAPTGTVSGSIASSLGGGLSGVGVIITPDGGSAQPTVFTAATTGAFSATVPAPLSGTAGGRITGFTNVPGNCTAPTPAPGTLAYTGLANGGSATIAAITFVCVPPPAIYPLTPTIRASTRAGAPATEREIVLNIDLTQNRSENYGAAADSIQGITFEFGFTPGVVVPVSSVDGDGNPEGGVVVSPTQRLETAIFNPATAPNQATLAVFSTGGPQQAGAGNVAIFRFNAPAGATVNVWLSQAANGVATDLVPFFRGPSPANALFSAAAPLVVTVP